jgi:hypothetical protein
VRAGSVELAREPLLELGIEAMNAIGRSSESRMGDPEKELSVAGFADPALADEIDVFFAAQLRQAFQIAETLFTQLEAPLVRYFRERPLVIAVLSLSRLEFKEENIIGRQRSEVLVTQLAGETPRIEAHRDDDVAVPPGDGSGPEIGDGSLPEHRHSVTVHTAGY